MIFVIYYTRFSPTFIEKFIKLFPHVKNDLVERFPDNADETISLCFRSIQRFHPNSQCILLTDLHTNLSVPKGVELIRYDLDPNQLAYMRLKAQLRFLETIKSQESIIFCDYDILFQSSLNPIFLQSFDLGLVYRKIFEGNPHPAPINGGLLVIHQKGVEKSLHFLKLIHTYYLKHFSNHKEWGGFQASLNEMIGPQNIHNTYPNQISVNETRILLLPATTYNYTIGDQPYFMDYQPEKIILHFKGGRKKDMAHYWNAYLS